MGKIAIIKTGAAGDVVRTTSLLRILDGDIFWITADKNKQLLPIDQENLTMLSVKEAFQDLKKTTFELVISLEEDTECAKLASEINTGELTGIYFAQNKINYTDSAASWFGMSRVSKLGMERSNKLKAENTESYQSHIFGMIGKEFTAEPYKIFTDTQIKPNNKMIGIEKRTGTQWPNKNWWGYDELVNKLENEGHKVKVFTQRTDIRDYFRDIAQCSYVVSGDTLAMHVALAYQKRCTAIFNCTSPQEIYDYGLLKKVISPLLDRYFYSSSYDKEAIESVSLNEVYNSLLL